MAPPTPPDGLLATMTDRQGRTVWLTEERWKHIIEGHPEVERHLPGLKRCVEMPKAGPEETTRAQRSYGRATLVPPSGSLS